MFIAIVLQLAALASATPPSDEPARTVERGTTEARVGTAMPFLKAVSAQGTLELVGASTTPIGIDVAPVDPPLQAQLKVDGGALVARVVPESEAAKAGVKVYDVVLGVDGRKVSDVLTLRKALEDPSLGKKTGGGEKVFFVTALDLVREAKPIKVDLRRSAKPQIALTTEAYVSFTNEKLASKLVGGVVNVETVQSPHRLGVSLAEADDVLRAQLKLAQGQGLVVTQVAPGSPAATAGVQKNDVIIAFEKTPALGVAEFTARLQANGDKLGTLELKRAGATLKVKVRPKKDEVFAVDQVMNREAPKTGEFVTDLLILADKDGKRRALTGEGTLEFLLTPAAKPLVETAGSDLTVGIDGEIKALRQTVDRLQSELGRLERERVVEKLQEAAAKLEAAAAASEKSKK